MDIYLKAVAGVSVTIIISLTLAKKAQDISMLLTLAVCCMVMGVAVYFLTPLIDFIKQLQTVGQLDTETFKILLKAVGIGLVGEISSLICADSGNTALGKALQILSVIVILWLSLPLMTALLQTVQSLLGEL